MKKYKLEGNIDFFSELYKSLDENENKFKTDEDDNNCLITNQPLVDKFVKLDCGHKFNYIPLFNDIKNHKLKFNSLEGSNSILKNNEIRCPYCRKRQLNVLPYYEEFGFDKVNGVNNIDISIISEACVFSQKGCDYDYNNNYISQGSLSSYHNNCLNKYVYSCQDGNQYCWSHHKLITNIINKQKNQKIKDEAKKVKDEAKKVKDEAKKVKDEAKKVKEEAKKAKDEAKEDQKKAKEDQKKAKEEQKKSPAGEQIMIDLLDEENVVISILSNLNQQPICCKILKSGTLCCKNIYLDNLCKRHYNIKNKKCE
jgi:hypothetical protein